MDDLDHLEFLDFMNEQELKERINQIRRTSFKARPKRIREYEFDDWDREYEIRDYRDKKGR